MARAEETKFPGISGAGLVMRGSPKTWPPATLGHHPEQLRCAQINVDKPQSLCLRPSSAMRKELDKRQRLLHDSALHVQKASMEDESQGKNLNKNPFPDNQKKAPVSASKPNSHPRAMCFWGLKYPDVCRGQLLGLLGAFLARGSELLFSTLFPWEFIHL